jgi:hypothetical protein
VQTVARRLALLISYPGCPLPHARAPHDLLSKACHIFPHLGHTSRHEVANKLRGVSRPMGRPHSAAPLDTTCDQEGVRDG